MGWSPFESTNIKTRTKASRELAESIRYRSFSKEELLNIEGTFDSITGVRCKCGNHVLSLGTCSMCGIYAALCSCKENGR